MTHLADLFSPADLTGAVHAGHVVRHRHPHLPLVMLSYTRACQYAGAWTPVTTRCRGLVVDERTGTVVAWPFEKFFNAAEHALGRTYAPALPDEPFRIYDKIDGSLGIVFHFDGAWHAATKGSFTSPQAQWAQRWLDSRDTSGLQVGTTYLAEILHPGNRIVVDYGNREDLVLLGAFSSDGVEIDLADASPDWEDIGSVVRTWPAMELGDLLARTETNRSADGAPASGLTAEGYVLRFASGVRTKAKLADYVRLHKAVTGTNEVDIWRYMGVEKFATHPVKKVAKALGCPVAEVTALSGGTASALEALLALVPDESDSWVRTIISSLEEQARQVRQTIDDAFAELAHLSFDRAAFARAVRGLDKDLRAGLFLRLDGHDCTLDLHVWRTIRPVLGPGAPDATSA
ncbi:RNA ligase [Streptomyces yaizuensis]|uniref:T4 RnlA family RNA ligase n=1 Tax=Streptomyces yaizuensis TaxID=2989713 RepID=A0ABQ5P6R5_9ACTN|nr:RNA ligase [Streptomyces sp. YSPA8]GLF98278.1 T4 RnlA family RNA ligase [Streptomyces sp. YSPA8]